VPSFVSPGHTALAALAAALLALPAAAQTAAPRQLPPAVRMLAVFEEDAALDRTGGTEGIVAVQYAVTHPAELAPSRLDSLLAGLERMATTSETRKARIRAVMMLGRMEDSASFERIVRVYRAAAAYPEVRDMVISVTDKPKLPRHVTAWAALLMELVTKPAGQEDFENAPFEAMRHLVALGAPGQDALRNAHQRGLVSNPEVHALLAEWVRQDFKLQESMPGS
jgi:hypothetical protein